ncbi:MAG: SDR family oxidoreductase [Bacteroidales bacterium]|jgi:NADP-dependent 3-hydroxy acid dehydrogenase YdfG|nr:SDR family oxidoreductase [Bacteroidales bacterium]NLM92221.1 SDR family oxidoreductase [Bacteroidales bacterium]
MTKITMITGATSGIGRACAMRFASLGHKLILTGRRVNRLENLKKEIENTHEVAVLVLDFDVRNNHDVRAAIDGLSEEWKEIDILINNAGLALGLDPIEEGSLEDWEQMIDTNIKGLLYVTRAVAPGMKARKTGHIINIGSIAGREVYPKGNVYCSTKHAVDALSQGMRIDLLSHGIRVTQISPGAVKTEFSKVRFHGDEERAQNVYKGFKPLEGDDVAGVVAYVTTLPPHVNINDLLIMPTAQASAAIFHKE